MNSKEQFDLTVNHKQPDRVVVDLGSTAVTGIHVRIVECLRDYYGLEKKQVRVIEPFQMLGEIDAELQEQMGIDVIGAWGPTSMFGFNNHKPFKLFKTFWGQEVLVPENFNTSLDPNGDLVIYPEGYVSVSPSGKMPKSGYFFDAITVNEESLQVEDNLEEFTLVGEDELDYWEKTTRAARFTGKAVIASLGGTALGDIALVPGLQLKNPKGIRDISEWYMSTIMRSDYIRTVFEH
jgi:hypothetical protein